MPAISVILTSFNHGKYIAETIDSVLAQTFRDFELIIWDDLSSDDSWSVIQSYSDKRIKAFRNSERHRGWTNINQALSEVAQGRYIAIHHSDDVWEPEKLALQFEFLEKNAHIGAVFSHATAIGEDSQPFPDPSHYYSRIFSQQNRSSAEWLRFFFYTGNALCHPSVLIRKQCYDDCGMYRPWLIQLGDLDMWIRLCLKYEIHIMPQSLVRFRIRTDEANASGNRPDTRTRHTNEYFILLENYLQLNDMNRLLAVFPSTIQYWRRKHGNARFALAMTALGEHTHGWHHLFGMKLIYDMLADPEVAHGLKLDYQFDYMKFVQMTGQFAVFSWDAPVSARTDQVNAVQPAWIEPGRWAPTEREWAEHFLSERNVPELTLIVVRRNAQDADHLTIQSIERQWQPVNWHSVVLNDDTAKVLNAAIQQVRSGWVAVVDAGDQLSADTIFHLALAIGHHPEWQLIYTDEDIVRADGSHINAHFKPDFNLDYLHSLPYTGNLVLIRKTLFDALGGFSPDAQGVEEYDLILRAWEKLGAQGIGHIAEVLYHRRDGSLPRTAIGMERTLQSAISVLEQHFKRCNVAVRLSNGPFPPSVRVRYPLERSPLVSIVIPTRNQLHLLRRCLESIIEKTRYLEYEILVVDNDSDDLESRQYLELIEQNRAAFGNRIHILRYPGPFNFSAMNNMAAQMANGELILLLNNDTAVLHEDWLDEMVSHALRPSVGIVGAKLLYPDGRIQHAGVLLGLRGPAEHQFIGEIADSRGYYGRAQLTQNLSAVTGACLMLTKNLYFEVGGLDETRFQVSYNDIDLCMKVIQAGKQIVWTPWAILLHEGSASQKGNIEQNQNDAKHKRFQQERLAFYRKWIGAIAHDPAYNRHLSLSGNGYENETLPILSVDPHWKPRPRILAMPYDQQGSGEYRVIAPMRALRNAGKIQGDHTMRFLNPAEIERIAPVSIVLQKPLDDTHHRWLAEHAEIRSVFRVFELDDLLTNLPVKSHHRQNIYKDMAKRIRMGAEYCQRMVVSTEMLAQEYKGLIDEIVIQPNYVESAKWSHLQPKHNRGRLPRVGWAGGIGHTGDLEMLADVVRDLADEVEWVFFGLCPEGLIPYVHEFHPGVSLADYPAKLASLDLDLAIAPLEDNAFNNAKSHLRLLEYGILGYPVICSNVTPYQNDIPAWRVGNKYRDWVKAIREIIHEPDTLASASTEIRSHIHANWLLENNLDQWLKVWLPS